jgi:polysaccharide pyruvyl transferase WcaK-like protein
MQLTVFDEGYGVRPGLLDLAAGPVRFAFCGATDTRRFWQRRSFWNIRASHWLGGLGNPAVARLRAADAVLDISGGDSFTDLYGPRRFHSVTFAKRLALEHRRPLVLLPQTYGPFRDPRSRALAADIVRRAALAWSRDARSFAVLQDLLGPDFDPQRHRCGVDVAFALEARPPRQPLSEPIATWLADEPDRRATSVIGFNVSGLIWHDPASMRARYGFQADYRQCVLGFLRRVFRETDARVVLVPHVLTPPGHYESDPAANAAVVAALQADADGAVAAAAAQRVACVPAVYEPMETKWLIARTDWFCGTRMHACIAGLSSGVPTAAIAYSLKTQGVFETCAQGAAVADPRARSTPEIIDDLWATWTGRAAARADLADAARANGARAAAQLTMIALRLGLGAAPAHAPGVPA